MKPSILEAVRGLFGLPGREKGAIDPKAPAARLREHKGFVASLKQNRKVELAHQQTDANEQKKKSPT